VWPGISKLGHAAESVNPVVPKSQIHTLRNYLSFQRGR
jgi:hypothetical protein